MPASYTCSACNKRAYQTKAEAKRMRSVVPGGNQMRAYRCAYASFPVWHPGHQRLGSRVAYRAQKKPHGE